METLITNGIKVSVQPSYQPEYSRPALHRFVFSYRITIENLSSHTVQLLRRHWFIWDGNGAVREVEGEGVVGQQPTLAPGESHEYASWCDLATGIGNMRGAYLMRRHSDGDTFQVGIPLFRMVAPVLLN
ncbi:MAG: Co2+/Mg2+ efflux protein ApaG [Lewinellaceae bacterium]|nr:Co2+/Mg2+ efflux protein ApaG [Lewinellaceae bacterium]